MRVGGHFEALIQDLRFSIRLWMRERASTVAVLVTLALSVGSTTAVLTLVDVLLLRPLPVSSPERLFSISAPGSNVDLSPSYYSHGFYEHLRTSGPLFRNLLATSTTVSSGVNLADGAVTDRIQCELASGNYFDVLGVGAAAGRILSPEDDRTPGAHPVLVLSYAFWQRRFAGAPDVVGRTVSVNGTPFTVVGVADRGFFGAKPGFGPDIWAPLMMVQPVSVGGISPLGRTQNYLEMIVRLDPHVDVRHAQAMATTVYTNWLGEGAPSQPPGAPAPALHLTPAGAGHSLLRAQYSQPLLLLTAAVFLLLLIACANIATLLMSRTTARAREIAVGRRVGPGRQGPTSIEVVGVVENAKYLSVREAPMPTVYLPFREGSPMTLHVKTPADPRSALRVIEQELQALDPKLPLFQVQTIEARVDDALRQERLVATLATILGVSAMLVAAVGIYGLISFSAAQRTREIGIRIAVGAEPRQILLMVLGRAFVLVAVGIAVGLPLALGSLGAAASLLYGVTPWQPAILAGVLTVVTVVAASAALVPARRAARTDAWTALRSE